MTVLTIRDVPDSVKETLAREAARRGQSLQAYLLGVVTRQADFRHNVHLLADIELQLRHGGGADASAPDAATVLAQARAERDEAGEQDQP